MKNINEKERNLGWGPKRPEKLYPAATVRLAPLDHLDPASNRPHSAESIRRDSRLDMVNCLDADFLAEFARDLRRGLALPRKAIPSKYFYDERGSELFEEICRLPEYYPTRTELAILERCAPRIMAFFQGEKGDLVEIGCGSDQKVRKLLEGAGSQSLANMRYVPMDISGEFLRHSARRLLRDYRSLKIHALVADFTRHLERLPSRRKLIAFFGGTFGNFTEKQGLRLLRRFAEIMNPADRLLIGLDMIKPVAILEAAYNDSAGVTARFNLNILDHVNRGLKGQFNLADFSHRAFFNRDLERIEMHLVAKRKLQVTIADLDMQVEMEKGETIHTEISRKFTRQSARQLFLQAGLSPIAWHTDPKGWFSLIVLQTGRGWQRGAGQIFGGKKNQMRADARNPRAVIPPQQRG